MIIFLFIGILLILFGLFTIRRGMHHHERELVIGSYGLIAGGLILVIFFGFFYRLILQQ